MNSTTKYSLRKSSREVPVRKYSWNVQKRKTTKTPLPIKYFSSRTTDKELGDNSGERSPTHDEERPPEHPGQVLDHWEGEQRIRSPHLQAQEKIFLLPDVTKSKTAKLFHCRVILIAARKELCHNFYRVKSIFLSELWAIYIFLIYTGQLFVKKYSDV